MGIVTMGPPEDLVIFLRDRFSMRFFVETGTYQGSTAFWASRHFDLVYTIELSDELREAAQARFGKAENIEFVAGDSRQQLPRICQAMDAPALFWLDAHYSAGITAGAGSVAPVLEEIDAIDRHTSDSIILIDDARLFESSPPEPHSLDEYPSLFRTLQVLNHKSPRYVAIVDDVIVAIPEKYAQPVRTFLQQKATQDSRMHNEQSEKGDYRKAYEHLVMGFRGTVRGVLRRLSSAVRKRL